MWFSRSTRHVPRWVRNLPRGLLRSYLIAVFLPLTRQQAREMQPW